MISISFGCSYSSVSVRLKCCTVIIVTYNLTLQLVLQEVAGNRWVNVRVSKLGQNMAQIMFLFFQVFLFFFASWLEAISFTFFHLLPSFTLLSFFYIYIYLFFFSYDYTYIVFIHYLFLIPFCRFGYQHGSNLRQITDQMKFQACGKVLKPELYHTKWWWWYRRGRR